VQLLYLIRKLKDGHPIDARAKDGLQEFDSGVCCVFNADAMLAELSKSRQSRRGWSASLAKTAMS